MPNKKTVIVTGASQGIGAAVAQAFLAGGYNVTATARSMSGADFPPSPALAVVDGDIGLYATAEDVAHTAIDRFGTIDHLVNNAGIFSVKPFTDYTAEDFRALVSTNLEGFIFLLSCGTTDVETRYGWQRHFHHSSSSGQPDSRRSGVDSDDHQRRAQRYHYQPGD